MNEPPCNVIYCKPASLKSNQIRIALYRSDNDIPPVMVENCKLACEKLFTLPKDWSNKDSFPVVFRFESTVMRCYVGLKNYDEINREIILQWKL